MPLYVWTRPKCEHEDVLAWEVEVVNDVALVTHGFQLQVLTLTFTLTTDADLSHLLCGSRECFGTLTNRCHMKL